MADPLQRERTDRFHRAAAARSLRVMVSAVHYITSAKHVSHERSAGVRRTLTQPQPPHKSFHPIVAVPQPAAAQVASVSREQAPADATARLDDEDCGGEWVRWRVGGSACAGG